MKAKFLIIACGVALTFSSCATMFGGKITECQKRTPQVGEPKREVRWGSVAANILLGCPECILVDLITGAIYKPCDNNDKKAK